MSIKKKIALAMGGTALAASMVAGGTYALFTSNASNTGNTFAAGTLTISDITGGAAFSSSQHIGNLAPGDSDSKTLTIKNTGSLNAWVKIDSATKTGDLFGGANPVSVTYDAAPVLIPAGGQYTFNVGYSFPSAAGNEYQGDTGSVTFNVKAVQSKNNGDANNNGVVDAGDAPGAWN